MSIVSTFDNATEAVLNPTNITEPVDGFPETVIVTFGQRMLDLLRRESESEIVSGLYAGFDIPIYQTEYRGQKIAFYLTTLGGPAVVALLEEVIAKGGRKFLLFGSCGSLDKDMTDGHIVVPTAAFRDEGTSYHYAPAEIGDFIEVKTATRLLGIVPELNVPALAGKTWTTDAFYRETRRNLALRKQAGCITVEMECASVMALADFRGVDIYQFLYTADNLGGAQWEPRIMGNMPDDARVAYVRIALEVATRLSSAKSRTP
jgi:uridine phosphorylase